MKSTVTNRTTRQLKLPVISITLAALSMLFFFSSDAAAFFQYDRTALAGGELWRLITGHLTHWSFDHLLWCVITFLALGSICEYLARGTYILTLAVSAVTISLASWLADPNMLHYRGLSGICSSVFILGTILLARKGYAVRDRMNIILPATGAVLFFAKIIYEYCSGQALFVDSSSFAPVPLVHLVGGIVGILVFLARKLQAVPEPGE